MKLSEIPGSVYHSAKMLLIPVKKLGKNPVKRIPVVVSLTSIPTRLKTLAITIRSMMQQEYLPEKIILWLKEDLKGQIPASLSKLEGDLFEIRFSPYGFSHRKLIHSLEAFPDTIIITCDDDVIYHPSTLRITYEEHLKHPKNVIGNRCRNITYKNGELLSYGKWPFINETPQEPSLVMPVGAFCVLYPAGSLNSQVQDVDLFMKLAPKADDLWFKMMAVLNDTVSLKNSQQIIEPVPIMGTQFVALKTVNKGQDLNRVQWNDLMNHFNLTPQKIKEKLG
ncbi:MAG: glycosyl transferase [Nonlabens sp.]|uniref:glycosyl transferase n=1 Tax=Nonlabens sp. TaxID=1888209 RepID=UPI003EF8F86F